MSAADLETWRERFQEPGADELDGGEIPAPPAGLPGRRERAMDTWPTCADG